MLCTFIERIKDKRRRREKVLRMGGIVSNQAFDRETKFNTKLNQTNLCFQDVFDNDEDDFNVISILPLSESRIEFPKMSSVAFNETPQVISSSPSNDTSTSSENMHLRAKTTHRRSSNERIHRNLHKGLGLEPLPNHIMNIVLHTRNL